jgi:hypothetical protein
MAMTQVSLIAYLTAGAFLGLAYFDYFYNLILIVVVANGLLARHVAGLPSATTDPGKAIAADRNAEGPPRMPSPAMSGAHKDSG